MLVLKIYLPVRCVFGQAGLSIFMSLPNFELITFDRQFHAYYSRSSCGFEMKWTMSMKNKFENIPLSAEKKRRRIFLWWWSCNFEIHFKNEYRVSVPIMCYPMAISIETTTIELSMSCGNFHKGKDAFQEWKIISSILSILKFV
ncbi:hypothetical protein T08_1994 [Trichinella sp. T8]|nr:hypothetical protein T08_1994 [Trichinella sp. T8]